MHGCCELVNVTKHVDYIEIDKHTYCITIVYCKNCGSVKTTTNVRHIRDGNKTEY
jgi:hypothetical protein